MFKSINREALIIIGKKPFHDWAKYIMDETPVPQYYTDPYEDKATSVFLIPDSLYEESLTDFVKKHYSEIFVEQLSLWLPEVEHWPQNLSWEVFCEWFEIIHAKGISDLGDGDIKELYPD